MPDANSDNTTISVEDALRLATGDAWLLDVREQDEWDAGHLPAAHLIPMSVIGMRMEEVPTDKDILVICHSGARSERVASALRDVGYNAVNVTGGMMAARASGAEVVTGDQPDGASRPLA
ncbi:MAG: hypothetical protein JWQ43_1159 [Glaciihabitans sp.]|nr:hypothetical protein [Glaciihabitans sp.]